LIVKQVYPVRLYETGPRALGVWLSLFCNVDECSFLKGSSQQLWPRHSWQGSASTGVGALHFVGVVLEPQETKLPIDAD
jgi:hypothetical protein